MRTVQGQQLRVSVAGMHNSDQGPDFLDARIRLDDTNWAGNIEVHVNSSDWKLHNHSADENYHNVVLHVVWNDDVDLALPFPTFELRGKVSGVLLKRYEELMQSALFIPCETQITSVQEFHLNAWKERLLVERLQQRAKYVEQLLQHSKQHWEEVCFWMLARNFGTKVNGDAFERVARSIPYPVIAKHRPMMLQLESILMGQAGLLDKYFVEAYPKMLKKEYRFMQKKFGIKPVHHPLYLLRMRPANFPTIRLAQLAMLLHEQPHFFDAIRNASSATDIQRMLNVTANDYWHYHYVFDEPGTFRKKAAGAEMARNVMINTVIPLLYTYGYYHKTEVHKIRALDWLRELTAEHNRITKEFGRIGLVNASAFDSQALLQLKKYYCDEKRCLQCAIGNSILKEVNIMKT